MIHFPRDKETRRIEAVLLRGCKVSSTERPTDFSILVTDSFNEELAREAMKITDDVFDSVYTIVFRRFPRTKEDALQYKFLEEWEKFLPNTARAIRGTVDA